jgi:hypothetical protein
LLVALQLLRGADFASVSPTTATASTPAKTTTAGSKASLAGDLNFVGQITTITMPVKIPSALDLSGIDFTPTDKPSDIAARLKYGSGL